MHELVRKLQDDEMNWYIDIIPTASSDDDIIRIVDSYVDIPVLLLTSDKELYERLPGKAVFIKSKGDSNGVRIIYNTVKRRVTRLQANKKCLLIHIVQKGFDFLSINQYKLEIENRYCGRLAARNHNTWFVILR